MPIPSPALFEKIGQRFRRSVASFAEANHIPWIKFAKEDRKADVMRPHLERQAATGRSGGGGDRAGAGAHRGARVRVLTRDSARVPRPVAAKVGVVVGDLHELRSLAHAMDGVTAIAARSTAVTERAGTGLGASKGTASRD